MKKFLGIVLVLFAVPAFAADLNYNYLELGYQRIDLDDDLANVDGDGFGIAGSFEVGDNWFVGASYAQASFDFGIDLDQLGIGLGYHTSISNNTDFYGSLQWVRAEVSADGFGSADEDGFGATIGLRGMVGDKVELSGHVGYVDFGDGSDGTAVGAGLLYNLTDNVGLGIFVDVEEDVTSYGAGVRFYW